MTETLETLPALRASGVRLGAIVLNRVAPPTLPRGLRGSVNGMDAERLAGVLAGAGIAVSAPDAAALRAGALAAETRRRAQLAFREPLARAGPILVAPELGGTSPLEVTDALASFVTDPSGEDTEAAGSLHVPPSFPSRRAMPKPDPSLAPHLEDARVVVVCGAGGVGKTSVSAAIALHRAASGTETALLTVDPARRLATALRLPMLAGERAEVPVGGGRTLQAMQLDTQRTFDELIERNAGSPERRDRILAAEAATLLICQLLAWLLVAYVGFALLLWPFVPGGLTLSLDDLDIAIAGATHGFTPCRDCAGGPYDNSMKNLFDYVAKWINERFH